MRHNEKLEFLLSARTLAVLAPAVLLVVGMTSAIGLNESGVPLWAWVAYGIVLGAFASIVIAFEWLYFSTLAQWRKEEVTTDKIRRENEARDAI